MRKEMTASDEKVALVVDYIQGGPEIRRQRSSDNIADLFQQKSLPYI